jgi:hypothetical protein
MTGRQLEHPNLLAGPAADPETRERQTRGLKRGNVSHGAYGGPRLAQLREQHAAALAGDFPHFDPRRRALLADRLARIDLVAAWADENGIAKASKAGDVQPIVDKADRWAAAADVLLEKAGEAERHAAANRTDPETAAWIAYANGEGPKPDAELEHPPADAQVIA